MELVVVTIQPEYRKSETKNRKFYTLEQYRLEYVLHIPGKTEIHGQQVVDDTGPLDLELVKETILSNLKKAFS